MDDLHRTIEDFAENFYDFHKNPTSEVFNAVIATEGNLFGNLPEDPRDVECSLLDGDDEESHRAHVKYAKKKYDEAVAKMKKTGYQQPIKYCVTGVLSWVYAAIKEFPWLAEECIQPLIIERSQHFTRASYTDTIVEPSCDNDEWSDNFEWFIG